MSLTKLATAEIKVEVSGPVVTITLNRPESSNAYSEGMIATLVNVVNSYDVDDTLRVLVITGAGKHFCAGGDVKAMEEKTGMFAGEANELRLRYERGIQQISLALEKCSKPLIAAINGAAIGAGLDLACMCDIRLCSESAVFAESFAAIGLVPGDGGSFFLQRVIGYAKAMEMSLTAQKYSSTEALQMGLVSKIVSGDKLITEANELASKIAKNSPIAISLTKKSIKHAYSSDLGTTLDLLSSYQSICQRTNDHFRALKAIKNKTSSVFEGN